MLQFYTHGLESFIKSFKRKKRVKYQRNQSRTPEVWWHKILESLIFENTRLSAKKRYTLSCINHGIGAICVWASVELNDQHSHSGMTRARPGRFFQRRCATRKHNHHPLTSKRDLDSGQRHLFSTADFDLETGDNILLQPWYHVFLHRLRLPRACCFRTSNWVAYA